MKRVVAAVLAASLTVPMLAGGGTAGADPEVAAASAATVEAAAVIGTTSALLPLSPDRILDTRIGLGGTGPLPVQGQLTLGIAGRQGVPAGITAAILNVTIVDAAKAGFVQALPSPAGDQLGRSSNLNVERPGQTIPNLVIAPVGDDGNIVLYAEAGGHLVADLLGVFVGSTTATSGRYSALPPSRILDTRTSTQVGYTGDKPGRDATIQLQVTGAGGVPASGVSAVALNVTATEATGDGFIQVVPSGGQTLLGTSSNLNVATGQTIANLVVVPVGADGKVTLYTNAGSHLLADVTGWFTDASAADSGVGLFTAVTPARVLDTRGAARPAESTTTRITTGDLQTKAGLPATGVAAVAMNVTATEAAAPGFVQSYPFNQASTGSSSTLNVERAGQTIPNAAITAAGAGGAIGLFVQNGTHLLADVAGWFSAPFGANPVPIDPGGDGGTEEPEPVDPGDPQIAVATDFDALQLSSRLIFKTQGGDTTDPETFTLRNPGGQPLVISNIRTVGTIQNSPAQRRFNFQLVGDDPAVAGQSIPDITIPPGGTAQIQLVFRPEVTQTYAVHSDAVLFSTNAPSQPTASLVLKGLYTQGYEGANEATLAAIQGVVGYGTDIGSNALEFGKAVPGTNQDIGIISPSDEVDARYFRAFDATQQITMRPIASFTNIHTGVPSPDFRRVGTGGGSGTPILRFEPDGLSFYRENQKLFPVPDTSGALGTSFNPLTGGGNPNVKWSLAADVNTGDQSTLSTATPATDANCPNFRKTWRTYQLRTLAGAEVSHSYLVAFDLNCENGDFNDYVFLLNNVIPYSS